MAARVIGRDGDEIAMVVTGKVNGPMLQAEVSMPIRLSWAASNGMPEKPMRSTFQSLKTLCPLDHGAHLTQCDPAPAQVGVAQACKKPHSTSSVP